jgi:hypothetical protein
MIVEDLQPLAVKMSELKLAGSNPRIGDVEAIRKSYERFGQRKPLVAHRKSKEIIAGNHQYQAAAELGWDEIAVVWVDDDDETAVAYSIADNRIGQLGEWNVEELVLAFDTLDPTDLATVGFSEVDIEDFRALADEHAITAPATTVDGGLGKQSNNDADGKETKVKKDSTYDEFLERYMNRATRGIVLYYAQEEYAKMVEALDTLAERFGLEDNATTVQKLVEDALK